MVKYRIAACLESAAAVRRVIGLRHLLAAGLGVGAWLIIGSASAFAADVTQSNHNRSTTVVNNQGAHSAAPVSGPIVAPVTVGVGTNANGPVNVNVLARCNSAS